MSSIPYNSDCTVAELQEDRNYICEICGAKRGTERHHAIYGRDVRFKKLNCAINYQLVCHQCHMMYADSRKNRDKHILKQISIYGEETYQAWLDSLPFKLKYVQAPLC